MNGLTVENAEKVILRDFAKGFDEIADRVSKIKETEKSYYLERQITDEILDLSNYSNYGFSSLGVRTEFPSNFLVDLYRSDENLAKNVLRNRINNYFDKDDNKDLLVRTFNDKICGVLTEKYSIFDDTEIIDILDDTHIKDMNFKGFVSEERLHLRSIDDKPIYVDGDDSPLYFCYFIDNSMVGKSCFKINCGLYRVVCTNGLMLGSDYQLVKRVHHGTNDDIKANLEFALQKIEDSKELIIGSVKNSNNVNSVLENMTEDIKREYLAKKLTISTKEADKIITLYNNTYGGKTKWHLTNAITEYARDINDIEKRTFLERRAFRVA